MRTLKFFTGKTLVGKYCIRYPPWSYVLRCLTATDSLLFLYRLYKGYDCRGKGALCF